MCNGINLLISNFTIVVWFQNLILILLMNDDDMKFELYKQLHLIYKKFIYVVVWNIPKSFCGSNSLYQSSKQLPKYISHYHLPIRFYPFDYLCYHPATTSLLQETKNLSDEINQFCGLIETEHLFLDLMNFHKLISDTRDTTKFTK